VRLRVYPSDLAPGLMLGEGVVLGDDLDLGAWVVIHAGTRVGDRCEIQDGAVLGKRPRLGARSTASRADLPPLEIGAGAVICAGAVVYAGARVAAGAIVGDQAQVRERVSVGEGAVVGRGCGVDNDVSIAAGARIQSNCYLAAHAVVEGLDDPIARTRLEAERALRSAFDRRAVEKRYLALVGGFLDESEAGVTQRAGPGDRAPSTSRRRPPTRADTP